MSEYHNCFPERKTKTKTKTKNLTHTKHQAVNSLKSRISVCVCVCGCVCVCARARACALFLSRVLLFLTPWTVAHQTPLSMEFSRQEYWNGLPFPTPGDLPYPGMEPCVSGIGRQIHHCAIWEAPIRELGSFKCNNKEF